MSDEFKVFICHNSKDKLQVKPIEENLRQEGFTTWMDEKDLIGFDEWEQKIEKEIPKMNAIAVFLGPSGFGEWQKDEIKTIKQEILRRQSKEQPPLRVGLVILKGCQQTLEEIQTYYSSKPQKWLFQYQIVDLCQPDDSMKKLIKAITTGQLLGGSYPLTSEPNVDYTRLRNLLAAGNWKEADYETYLVMLQVVGGEEDDWIRLFNIPSKDLHEIDDLWVKYSKGRFGFSVQKKIYLEVGGKANGIYYEEAWNKFTDKIKWRDRWHDNWIPLSQVNFSTTAPQGHLPFLSHLPQRIVPLPHKVPILLDRQAPQVYTNFVVNVNKFYLEFFPSFLSFYMHSWGGKEIWISLFKHPDLKESNL